MSLPFHILIIKKELEERKKRNKRYSLRALAMFFDVDAGYLSKCLSEKQVMSYNIAEQIIEKLNLTKEEREYFLCSIADQQRCEALYKHDKNLVDCGD